MQYVNQYGVKLLPLIMSTLLAACQPAANNDNDNGTSVGTGYDSCAVVSNSTFSISGVNTLIMTRAEQYNEAFDMDLRMRVNLEGISPEAIVSSRIWHPDGNLAEYSEYAGSWIEPNYTITGINFSNYSVQSALRQIPMTGYCIELVDNAGNRVKQFFEIENPDGTTPNEGSMVVHADDFASITAGGDFVSSLKMPSYGTATANATSISIEVTNNESRATEMQFYFWNDEYSSITDVILMASDIHTSGIQTYTFQASDLEFRDDIVVPLSDFISATVIIFDSGNGNNGHINEMSELGTWGYPVDIIHE